MTCDIGGMTASRVTIPNDDMFLAQIKDGGSGGAMPISPSADDNANTGSCSSVSLTARQRFR